MLKYVILVGETSDTQVSDAESCEAKNEENTANSENESSTDKKPVETVTETPPTVEQSVGISGFQSFCNATGFCLSLLIAVAIAFIYLKLEKVANDIKTLAKDLREVKKSTASAITSNTKCNDVELDNLFDGPLNNGAASGPKRTETEQVPTNTNSERSHCDFDGYSNISAADGQYNTNVQGFGKKKYYRFGPTLQWLTEVDEREGFFYICEGKPEFLYPKLSKMYSYSCNMLNNHCFSCAFEMRKGQMPLDTSDKSSSFMFSDTSEPAKVCANYLGQIMVSKKGILEFY